MLMILCLVLPMATEFVGCSGGGITRSEWIGMLSEQFGLNDYVTKSPVFTDVNQGSTYFEAVQSCADWKILDRDESTFRPDDPAEVKFAVLTAARAAGRNLSEKEALDLASKDKIVNSSSYSGTKGRLNKEKAAEILEWAKMMYLNTSTKDYSVFELNPDVKDISKAEGIVEVSEDVYITSRPEDQNISIGDIVILPGTAEDPEGVAKKITGIERQPNGSIKWTTVTPEIGEVCSDLEFASTVVPSAEDIILEEGATIVSSNSGNVSAKGGAKYASLGMGGNGSGGGGGGSFGPDDNQETDSGDDINGLNFTIKVDFTHGKISFSPSFESLFGAGENVSVGYNQAYNMTSALNPKAGEWFKKSSVIPDRNLFGKDPYDHLDDISDYQSGKISLDELKSKMKLSDDQQETKVGSMENKFTGGYEITGTIDIKNLYVKPELKLKKTFGIPTGIEKFTLTSNCTVKGKLSIKGELKEELKVCTIPCPTPITGLTVDIEVYLILTGDGELSVSLTATNYSKIEYQGGQTKKTSENSSELAAQVSVQIDFGPALGATVRLLGIGIIDTRVEVAARLKAEGKIRHKQSFEETNDELTVKDTYAYSYGVNVYIPIVKLSIGSSKGTLANKAGIKFSWIIIGEESAKKIEIIPETEVPIWDVVQTIKKHDDVVDETQPDTVKFDYLTLDGYFVLVEKGSTAKIKINRMPEGYSESDLIWESADPSIAQVSGGNVRGIESGSTSITVRTKDGMYQASCSVLVPSESVEFTPIDPT